MTTGFTAGAFDVLHSGHLHLLECAKQHCDFLVVGLHTDPSKERSTKQRPVQTTYERWTQLCAVKWVDKVIPYDTEADLRNLLATSDIQVRFLGSDYDPQSNEYNPANVLTGRDVCVERNIRLVFVPRFHSFSSTALRGRIPQH